MRRIASTSRNAERLQQLKTLAIEGKTVLEAASVLGLTASCVYSYGWMHQIKFKRQARTPNVRISERNRSIISHYLENHTLEEVGQKFGVTRERVRQILNELGVKPRSSTTIDLPRPPKKTQTFSERFWANVDKTPGQGPKGECWEYQGVRFPSGYGRFNSMGKRFYSHRLAYMLENRSAPRLNVLHKCDNPPCCNPDHLYDGTHQQNMHDRNTRGRAAWLRRLRSASGISADSFTVAQRHLEAGASLTQAALQAGISWSTAKKIQRGEHFFQEI